MPDMEKLFHSNAAPPIPKVRIKETIIMLRVLERSTLFWIKLLIPKEAIVPNKSNMIPPKTDAGMDFNKALILPKTEKTIPVTAAIRITAGLVTFVKDTAPVTSDYVVTGGPPTNPAKAQARPSPNSVRCNPGFFTKSLPVTLFTAYTSPMCSITGAMATGVM